MRNKSCYVLLVISSLPSHFRAVRVGVRTEKSNAVSHWERDRVAACFLPSHEIFCGSFVNTTTDCRMMKKRKDHHRENREDDVKQKHRSQEKATRNEK
mmetsp:Transcript_20194/g.56155  ORF Transcript_20194/g.56155 Transcript_20194/m.56155 type:complete len:98 (+) Transcript_20194:1341-1634(+)